MLRSSKTKRIESGGSWPWVITRVMAATRPSPAVSTSRPVPRASMTMSPLPARASRPLASRIACSTAALVGSVGPHQFGEPSAVGGGGADECGRVGAGVDAVALRGEQPGGGELLGGERRDRGLVDAGPEERSERAAVHGVEGGADAAVDLGEVVGGRARHRRGDEVRTRRRDMRRDRGRLRRRDLGRNHARTRRRDLGAERPRDRRRDGRRDPAEQAAEGAATHRRGRDLRRRVRAVVERLDAQRLRDRHVDHGALDRPERRPRRAHPR